VSLLPDSLLFAVSNFRLDLVTPANEHNLRRYSHFQTGI